MINTKDFNLLQKLSLAIATGLFSGLTPKSPGTAGSLACLIIWYLLTALVAIPTWFFLTVTIVIGTVATYILLEKLREKDPSLDDPQFVVIDEWAGILIPLLLANPSSIKDGLIAFALFRFFDITKFGPIGVAEKLPHAYGIMADDILAGIASLLVMAGIALL